MNDLVDLFKACEAARQTYERWALQNTLGKTPEERVNIDLGYKAAMKAYFSALDVYEQALTKHSAIAEAASPPTVPV